MSGVLDIQPSDLVVEEGDTIVLNCSFTEKYNGTRNASWLAFRHVGERFGPEYVSVLSDDTAQLRLPNATLHHFGFFVCYMLPNRSLGLGSSSVHVNVVSEWYIIQFCLMYFLILKSLIYTLVDTL